MAFGLPIKIEYRKGSTRTGTGSDGKKWSRVMHADYGHIKKTEGTDGEELDVYIGPHEYSTKVFVVDQMKAPEFKKHDEQKFMLGFLDAASAKKTYLKHYPSPKFFGGMTVMSIDDFKKKVQVEGKSGEKIAQRVSRDLDLLLEINLHKLAAGEALISAVPQVQAVPGLTEALAAVPVMGPDAVPVTRTYPAGGALDPSTEKVAVSTEWVRKRVAKAHLSGNVSPMRLREFGDKAREIAHQQRRQGDRMLHEAHHPMTSADRMLALKRGVKKLDAHEAKRMAGAAESDSGIAVHSLRRHNDILKQEMDRKVSTGRARETALNEQVARAEAAARRNAALGTAGTLGGLGLYAYEKDKRSGEKVAAWEPREDDKNAIRQALALGAMGGSALYGLRGPIAGDRRLVRAVDAAAHTLAGAGTAAGGTVLYRLHKRMKEKQAADRVGKIEDRLDDVGLTFLGAPYVARGLTKHLSKRKGALGAIGRGAGQVEHYLEHKIPNRLEVAGLALVAPGVIKPMAKGIDKVLPKKPAGGGVMGPGALTGGNDDLARGIGDNSLAKKVAAAIVSRPETKPVPTPQSISASKYAQLEQMLFDLDPAFEYLTEDEKRVKIAGLMGMAGRVSGLASRAATGVKNLGASISHGVQTGVARVRAQGAYDFAKNRALGAGADAMDASSAGLQASQKHLQTALKPPPAKAIPAPAAAAAGMPTTSPSSVTTPGRTPSGTAPGTPAKPLLTVGNIARGALVGGTGLALYGGYKGINAATGLLEREPYYAPAASPQFSQGM